MAQPAGTPALHGVCVRYICAAATATRRAHSSSLRACFTKLCPSVLLVAMITPIRCLKNLKDSCSAVIVLEQTWDIYWKRKDVGYFVAQYFFIP